MPSKKAACSATASLWDGLVCDSLSSFKLTVWMSLRTSTSTPSEKPIKRGKRVKYASRWPICNKQSSAMRCQALRIQLQHLVTIFIDDIGVPCWHQHYIHGVRVRISMLGGTKAAQKLDRESCNRTKPANTRIGYCCPTTSLHGARRRLKKI